MRHEESQNSEGTQLNNRHFSWPWGDWAWPQNIPMDSGADKFQETGYSMI